MDPHEARVFSVLCIHNVLRRSLNQLLKPLDGDEEAKACQYPKDYIGFLSAFLELLHGHHAIEETLEFPELEKGGFNFSKMQGEHKEMEILLEELSTIAASKDKSRVPVGECREKLIALQTLLEPHFVAEETMVTAEALKNSGLTAKQMTTLGKRIVKKAQTEDGTLTLPLIYYHLTEEERQKFWTSQLPWVLRKVIFPIILSKVHRSYWKLALHQP